MSVIVERECNEEVAWLPVEIVREHLNDALRSWELAMHATGPEAAAMYGQTARALASLAQATDDDTQPFRCRFHGDVEVELHPQHTEVWVCPWCHTLHEEEQRVDDDEMWRAE